MEELSFRIKSIRKDNHMTQKEFAEAIMVSQSYLSRIERGAEIPNKKLLMLIALKFNVNTDWLINGTSEPALSKGSNDLYDRAYASEITDSAVSTLNELSEKISEINDAVISGSINAIMGELTKVLTLQHDETIRRIIIDSIGSITIELCSELNKFSKSLTMSDFHSIKVHCLDEVFSQLNDLQELLYNRNNS